MRNDKCTIYENVFKFTTPHTITVKKALERIKNGASADVIARLRSETDQRLQDTIKKSLPCLVFTGVFEARRDDAIVAGSNTDLMVLDFDHVENLQELKNELMDFPHTFACWISPRGEGLKALILIADGTQHSAHFLAIEKDFPQVDKSGKNISRACFESHDPEIYVNDGAIPYTKQIIEETRTEVKTEFIADEDVYKRLRVWLDNKSEAFVSGNRNNYIFKLAGACCRYGMSQESAFDFILRDFATSDFSQHEIRASVKSSFRKNQSNSATFDGNKFVERFNHKEVDVAGLLEVDETDEEFSHVIFADDVKNNALDIYNKGYERLVGINAPVMDYHYKAKRQEITLLSGYGNMGKSTKLLWYLLNRAVLYGEKFALFPPESAPAEEFYLELVEMLAGCDCSAMNANRPPLHVFEAFYKFVNDHFFFVYPEKTNPTIATVKKAFLELIIKFKVDGVVIDPFNQLSHDRKGISREDFYLEEILSDFTKFAQQNDVYFWIVAHPNGSVERNEKDLAQPDMFRISGGGMWSAKMHNILIYHRPVSRSEPTNPIYTFTTEKIKKQKTVGKRGTYEAHYILKSRRFMMPFFDSELKSYDLDRLYDPLENNIGKSEYFRKALDIKEKPLPKMELSADLFN